VLSLEEMDDEDDEDDNSSTSDSIADTKFFRTEKDVNDVFIFDEFGKANFENLILNNLNYLICVASSEDFIEFINKICDNFVNFQKKSLFMKNITKNIDEIIMIKEKDKLFLFLLNIFDNSDITQDVVETVFKFSCQNDPENDIIFRSLENSEKDLLPLIFPTNHSLIKNNGVEENFQLDQNINGIADSFAISDENYDQVFLTQLNNPNIIYDNKSRGNRNTIQNSSIDRDKIKRIWELYPLKKSG
jgi:hypothetical protein